MVWRPCCGLATLFCGLATLFCGLVTLYCGLATPYRGLVTLLWSGDPFLWSGCGSENDLTGLALHLLLPFFNPDLDLPRGLCITAWDSLSSACYQLHIVPGTA